MDRVVPRQECIQIRRRPTVPEPRELLRQIGWLSHRNRRVPAFDRPARCPAQLHPPRLRLSAQPARRLRPRRGRRHGVPQAGVLSATSPVAPPPAVPGLQLDGWVSDPRPRSVPKHRRRPWFAAYRGAFGTASWPRTPACFGSSSPAVEAVGQDFPDRIRRRLCWKLKKTCPYGLNDVHRIKHSCTMIVQVPSHLAANERLVLPHEVGCRMLVTCPNMADPPHQNHWRRPHLNRFLQPKKARFQDEIDN